MKNFNRGITNLELLVCALNVLLLKRKNQAAIAPKKISNYILVEELHKNKRTRDFGIGIYKEGARKYFIKTWFGNFEDFAYYNLKNEYMCGRMLSNKKYTKKTGLHFVKPVDLVFSGNSVSVVFEFVTGRELSTFSPSRQVAILSRVMESFQRLDTLMSKSEKQRLQKRGLLFFLSVLLASFKFTGGAFWRDDSFTSECTVSHGDLHPDNVLLSKEGVFVVDLENVALRLKGYDLANLLTIKSYKKIASEITKNKNLSFNTKFLSNCISLQFNR